MFHGGKARNIKSTARRLWGYLARHPATLAMVALFVSLSTGLNIFGPYLLGRAIDRFIIPGDLPGLARIAVLLAAVYTAASLITYLQTILMVRASQTALRDLRRDLFAKLQSLGLRYFDRNPRGELMSRVANDVENISNVLAQSVTQLIASVLTIAGVAAMMLALNVLMAMAAMITLPLMVLITRKVAKKTRQGFQAQQKNLGELNGIIEETVTGQRVVKAYGREKEATETFDIANRKLLTSAISAQIYAGMAGPIGNFVNNTGFAVMAGVGGWMVVNGMTTVGTVAAFVTYTRQFTRPLNQIATMYNQLQSALAGAERVFEVIDETPEIQDAAGASILKPIRGHVEFRDVCFGYEPGVQVLKNVSFEAHPGQMIALVGPTGAGKTTIVNLLTRFYDIDSGIILVDGRDIREVQRDDLRKGLGIVLQDTFLFSTTVRENIRYGRLEATDGEVEAAAEVANAASFIRHLPQGFDTPLSEEGTNLSWGQRQLLAIARAVLADPSILVLDEATSSVDTRTEVHIQEAMLRLMKDRTSFVIAHRLSTIRSADIILVVNDGRIVERGTHPELIEANGFYHLLYMSQFRPSSHCKTSTAQR